MSEPRKKRQNTKPWKRIYGVDRKYTARVDRANERRAAVLALLSPDTGAPE